jgi:hypothetical protein
MTLTAQRGGTILDHLQDNLPLGLPSTIRVAGSGPLVPAGLDNGNGHTKIALLTPAGELVTQAVPTVYRAAKEIRGGAGITSYRVNSGPAFWAGAEALGQDGDALPIGTTSERLGDPRQISFLAAALVEALIAGGYKSGIHNLAVGLAVPNDEIVLMRGGDRLGVSKETKQAIKEHLFGKTFEVARTASNGQVSWWTLTYSTIMPQAQSIGTYLVWSRQPNGQTVDDGIEALSIVDIGTGDLQRTDVDVAPYRMTGEKLGRGTVTMARQLAAQLGHLRLNDAQAMQALISRTVRESGVRVPIDAEVDQVIAAEGQDLVARLLPVLQQQSRYVLFTGGGVLLDGLRAAIEERAAAMGKRAPRNYTMVPDQFALTLNATGALVAVVYAAAGSAS